MNGRTNEPISNAEIYIMGGDKEFETSSYGEYKLDLRKGDGYSPGDEVYVYVKHPRHGFHKELITIPRSMRLDIEISPNNMMRVTGTVLDASTGQPIEGIEVIMIIESTYGDDPTISTKSNKHGVYSFSIKKNVLDGQKYATMKFVDSVNEQYRIKEKVMNVLSLQSVKLDRTKESVVQSSKLRTIYFDSGRGVKRYEFRTSPNSNARASSIADGDKVKVLRSRTNEGIEWYEIEYNRDIGWIKAKFVR
jgi:hypothetical protein